MRSNIDDSAKPPGWAFGPIDARFRGWYDKIAADYKNRGRFGYAWEDGLGLPLGPRIYNNWATYWVLASLRTRRMAAVGYVLFGLTVGTMVALSFGAVWGLITAVLSLASPMVVTYYTHLFKPEFLWWPLVIAVAALVTGTHAVAAGLAWSTIAMVNVPVAVLTAILLGPVALIHFGLRASLGLFLVGALPGVIKGIVRGFHMARAGLMTALTTEQSRLWRRPWYPMLSELPWLLLFTTALLLAGQATSNWVLALTAIVAGCGLYWSNFRLMYLNDPESLHLALFVTSFGLAIGWESAAGAVICLIMLYNHPEVCGQVVPSLRSASFILMPHRRTAILRFLREFPALRPQPLPYPDPIAKVFERLAHGSRLVAEPDGDLRTQSRFRWFWVWGERILTHNGVDLANDEYLRILEPRLAFEITRTFSSGSAQETLELCQKLGADAVLVHSDTRKRELIQGGFFIDAEVDLAALPDFCDLMGCPPVTLTLMRPPDRISVVEPRPDDGALAYSSNTLTWKAESQVSYVIRHRYDPNFVASQDGQTLSVRPTTPYPDGPVFMEVRAIQSGPIDLVFRPHA
jgi:hypothetical protein